MTLVATGCSAPQSAGPRSLAASKAPTTTSSVPQGPVFVRAVPTSTTPTPTTPPPTVTAPSAVPVTPPTTAVPQPPVTPPAPPPIVKSPTPKSIGVAFAVLGSGERYDLLGSTSHAAIAYDEPATVALIGHGDTPVWLAGVAFQQNAVVVVAGGQRPTPGFAVVVLSVERAGSVLRVYAAVMAPAPDMIRPQVMADPYTAVQVSLADLVGVTSIEVVLG